MARLEVKKAKGLIWISGWREKPKPIGIAIRRNDIKLKKRVQKLIAEYEKKGVLKKIDKMWFGDPIKL